MLKYILSKVLKKSLNLSAIKNCKIDRSSKVCVGSHLVNSVIDKYSIVGDFCSILNTHIGSFCSIAENCIIGGANHPINWASTSPVFHQGKNILNKNFSTHEFETSKKTKIGNDVWIGSSCLIKGGVTIGDGAVIGMGSVVTKDVEPYSIVGGNPAKLIRKRFDERTIAELLKKKWWEMSNDEIQNISPYMNQIEKFIKII